MPRQLSYAWMVVVVVCQSISPQLCFDDEDDDGGGGQLISVTKLHLEHTKKSTICAVCLLTPQKNVGRPRLYTDTKSLSQ